MKIGILGTRGIPNHYGGYEQITTHLAAGLVQKGHQVTVYNSHNHPNQEKSMDGIQIQHCFDPEYMLGTAGQFVYDLNCLLDARNKKFDIVLFMGYTSSSVWGPLFPRDAVIISNMDGLEWKRRKYARPVRWFLKKAEGYAVRFSDFHIADSKAIASDLEARYGIQATYIPYGAWPALPDVNSSHENISEANTYHLLIARMEPENNIEMILDGYVYSGSEKKFIVVGNTNTRYGRYILKRFGPHKQITFTGGLFDPEHLTALRRGCALYFHGHSVGGTNPSLLEAMACGASLAVHKNPFNEAVIGNDAFYFSSSDDIASGLLNWESNRNEQWSCNNLEKIKMEYSWEHIINAYHELFIKCVQEGQAWESQLTYKTR